MSTDDEAMRLISQGRKIHFESFSKQMNPGIYDKGLHEEELAARPLGKMDYSRRQGVLAAALREFEKEGVGISAVELVRLVDMRLRRSAVGSKLTSADIGREIEETLDLVEQCQWRILLREKEWSSRTARLAGEWFSTPLTPQETEVRRKIENESYPLDFQKGLILMGVNGSSPAKREEAFWPFLLEQCKSSAQHTHMYGGALDGRVANVRSLDDFIEPPESQHREVLERYKREGWKAARWLVMEREMWQRHKHRKTKENRSMAGRKSGEVRKPKERRGKTSKGKK